MIELENPFGTLLLILFLITMNAFFVASEFALVKIRPSKIDTLIKQGSTNAKVLKKISMDLDRTITSTQVGITFASIALGFIGEPFFGALIINTIEGVNNLFNQALVLNPDVVTTLGFILSYAFVAFLHVVLGELIPKTLAIRDAEKMSLIVARPMDFFNRMSSPLLSFFIASTNLFLRLFRIEPVADNHKGEAFTEEELKIILKNSIFDKGIEEYEYRYIRNILEFNDTTVRNVLTPRIDVKALPIACSADDLLKLSVETGFSRIPIYTKNMDDIQSFVHIKDVLPFFLKEEEFIVKDHLREVISVYQEKSLNSVLNEMKSRNIQMAIIYDEYGSFDGIVTIEDILEEIFGEIQDEFDADIIHDELVFENGKYLVGGLVSIGNFNKQVRRNFDVKIESEDSVTLAGYVIELFQSELPDKGQKISDEDFHYEVISVSGKRIDTIEVTPKKGLPINGQDNQTEKSN